MGDPNGSIPTAEPTFYRPMFGAYGPAGHRTCVTFLSRQACHRGVPEQLGLRRSIETVQACRSVTKRQMVRNDRLPLIEVDPETYQVRVDGELATVPPADRLSLAQLYFLV
jgi:urease subunit alpha